MQKKIQFFLQHQKRYTRARAGARAREQHGRDIPITEFKSSLEEIDPVLRDMDPTMIQKMNKDKDRSDQKV